VPTRNFLTIAVGILLLGFASAIPAAGLDASSARVPANESTPDEEWLPPREPVEATSKYWLKGGETVVISIKAPGPVRGTGRFFDDKGRIRTVNFSNKINPEWIMTAPPLSADRPRFAVPIVGVYTQWDFRYYWDDLSRPVPKGKVTCSVKVDGRVVSERSVRFSGPNKTVGRNVGCFSDPTWGRR